MYRFVARFGQNQKLICALHCVAVLSAPPSPTWIVQEPEGDPWQQLQHKTAWVFLGDIDATTNQSGERTGQALVDALQQSPHRSTTSEPARSRMRVRDVDL